MSKAIDRNMNQFKYALRLAVLALEVAGCGGPIAGNGNQGLLLEDSVALKTLQREYPAAKVTGWVDRGRGDTLRFDTVPVRELWPLME